MIKVDKTIQLLSANTEGSNIYLNLKVVPDVTYDRH